MMPCGNLCLLLWQDITRTCYEHYQEILESLNLQLQTSSLSPEERIHVAFRRWMIEDCLQGMLAPCATARAASSHGGRGACLQALNSAVKAAIAHELLGILAVLSKRAS